MCLPIFLVPLVMGTTTSISSTCEMGNAAFDKVLFPIRSPSPSPSEGAPTRLLSHVSRACTALTKHGVGVEPPF